MIVVKTFKDNVLNLADKIIDTSYVIFQKDKRVNKEKEIKKRTTGEGILIYLDRRRKFQSTSAPKLRKGCGNQYFFKKIEY
ncbi:hypothetical protein ES708_19880 [subsurface metagenome]